MASSTPSALPPIAAEWLELPPQSGEPPLRCWWARPAAAAPRGAVLVLPEVFGVNGWVRSVADRLAMDGYGALALPIFARTAPGLELAYDEASLQQGRAHRDAVTAATVLADARRGIAWLQQQPGLEQRPVGCLGFCFGGHLALIVATLPQVAVTLDFYGARVSSFRPGGGPPTLELVPKIAGDLVCLVGDQDPLMPAAEIEAMAAALQAQQSGPRRELQVLRGAGHGFMCEQRNEFAADASAQGWASLRRALAAAL
jgi:carboxymethylenebutenolidase